MLALLCVLVLALLVPNVPSMRISGCAQKQDNSIHKKQCYLCRAGFVMISLKTLLIQLFKIAVQDPGLKESESAHVGLNSEHHIQLQVLLYVLSKLLHHLSATQFQSPRCPL